ncbi:MAG: GNAT family N-acetyltransferase [Chloroflexi bacterium]|nr:GNAT family N-acetyltransferase [Chloroflexota bacterium]
MPNETNRTDRDLMQLQINTLFHSDSAGRLRSVNEPGEPLAPRFFLGRTLHGNLWRVRHDLPASLVAELELLCDAEPIASDLQSPPQHYAAIKALLNAHAPIQAELRGPAWWIPAGNQPGGNVVLIDDANANLVETTFPWLLTPEPTYQFGPVAATVEQGQAVAVCFCSRIPGQATEAGVETLAAYRGKGYATAAVALWAATVRQRGWLPLYSTDWENHASQRIAHKLGMVRYGDDWSLQ